MRLSRDLHQKIERFFRVYYKDDSLKLPEVEIFIRRGAWIFSSLLFVSGITFGRKIFIKPSLIERDDKNRLVISKNLLVHELTHTMQYEREGFTGFLFKYFKDFCVNLRRKKKWDFYSRMESYLEIPHEIEARDSAEKFTAWLYSDAFVSSSSSVRNSK